MKKLNQSTITIQSPTEMHRKISGWLHSTGNMNITKFLLRLVRKIFYLAKLYFTPSDKNLQGSQCYKYVELWDEDANKYVYDLLISTKPCLISKFGTNELNVLLIYKFINKKSYSLSDYWHYINGDIGALWWLHKDALNTLCSGAGFFPNDQTLLERFYKENIEAVKEIDILGSYIYGERYLNAELNKAKRVNLDGYYAPFYYEHPWTRVLKGQKVLVVHPFAEDIERQYARREKLWANPEVLPEFHLITYKAVQSMMGAETGFDTWFGALQKMKDDISHLDFDIALIGCGAYGMPLAAHVKRLGRKAVHLAGWTQVLFGIIGKRWENNPHIVPMINDFWTHPSSANRLRGAEKVEGGCYW